MDNEQRATTFAASCIIIMAGLLIMLAYKDLQLRDMRHSYTMLYIAYCQEAPDPRKEMANPMFWRK